MSNALRQRSAREVDNDCGNEVEDDDDDDDDDVDDDADDADDINNIFYSSLGQTIRIQQGIKEKKKLRKPATNVRC